MESHVNPQPDDPHLRLSHQLHREIIRRKFTARQRSIIDFILTLSWGCGKPSAIIPRLKDFSLCGVRPNHIKKELLELSVTHVIHWDGAMNAFQLNKHYDQWDIEIVEGFNKKEMDRLISYNIEIKSPNLLKTLPVKGSYFPKEEVEELPNSGTNFPKEEDKTSQKRNFSLPKKGSRIVKIPFKIKAFQSPKESIKASIKKRTTTTTTGVEHNEYDFGQVFTAYEKNFVKDKLTPFDVDEFKCQFDDYGGEWLLRAMREAYKQGPDKRNLAYVHGILKGYTDRGGPDAERVKPQSMTDFKTPLSGGTSPRNRQRQEIEELRRKGMEERQREQIRSH